MKSYFFSNKQVSYINWTLMLDIILPQAKYVEVNVYTDEFYPELKRHGVYDYFALLPENPKKFFPGKRTLRAPLCDEMKDFVVSRSPATWHFDCLDDISLKDDTHELLATRTTDLTLIIELEPFQANLFNERGCELLPLAPDGSKYHTKMGKAWAGWMI